MIQTIAAEAPHIKLDRRALRRQNQERFAMTGPIQTELNDHERRLRALEHRQDHLEVMSALHGVNDKLNQMETKMDAQIQRAIDEIAETKAIGAAVVAGFALTGQQITDLKAEVEALKAKIAGGGAVTAEDMAALSASVTELDETNTATAAAVPQNTSEQARSSNR